MYYVFSLLRIALFNEMFVFSMVTPEKSSIKGGANTADAKTHTTNTTHMVPLHMAAWQRGGEPPEVPALFTAPSERSMLNFIRKH